MIYILGPIIVKRIKRIGVPKIWETLTWKDLVLLSPTESILPSLVNSRVSVHQFQAHYLLCPSPLLLNCLYSAGYFDPGGSQLFIFPGKAEDGIPQCPSCQSPAIQMHMSSPAGPSLKQRLLGVDNQKEEAQGVGNSPKPRLQRRRSPVNQRCGT